MVAEYYYNPNTNKTFTKDSAQKIAVPEGFSSITEDVYQGYVSQGVQPAGVVQAVTGLNTNAMDMPLPDPTKPPTGQGTQDPSQFIQGQVGARVLQPTLPTGTSVGQQLQLQHLQHEHMYYFPFLSRKAAIAICLIFLSDLPLNCGASDFLKSFM